MVTLFQYTKCKMYIYIYTKYYKEEEFDNPFVKKTCRLLCHVNRFHLTVCTVRIISSTSNVSYVIYCHTQLYLFPMSIANNCLVISFRNQVKAKFIIGKLQSAIWTVNWCKSMAYLTFVTFLRRKHSVSYEYIYNLLKVT